MSFQRRLGSVGIPIYDPEKDPVASFRIVNGRLHVKMKNGMDHIVPLTGTLDPSHTGDYDLPPALQKETR